MIAHPGRKRVAVTAIRTKTQPTSKKHDHEYDSLLVNVQRRFEVSTVNGEKLFKKACEADPGNAPKRDQVQLGLPPQRPT